MQASESTVLFCIGIIVNVASALYSNRIRAEIAEANLELMREINDRFATSRELETLTKALQALHQQHAGRRQ